MKPQDWALMQIMLVLVAYGFVWWFVVFSAS